MQRIKRPDRTRACTPPPPSQGQHPQGEVSENPVCTLRRHRTPRDRLQPRHRLIGPPSPPSTRDPDHQGHCHDRVRTDFHQGNGVLSSRALRRWMFCDVAHRNRRPPCHLPAPLTALLGVRIHLPSPTPPCPRHLTCLRQPRSPHLFFPRRRCSVCTARFARGPQPPPLAPIETQAHLFGGCQSYCA